MSLESKWNELTGKTPPPKDFNRRCTPYRRKGLEYTWTNGYGERVYRKSDHFGPWILTKRTATEDRRIASEVVA